MFRNRVIAYARHRTTRHAPHWYVSTERHRLQLHEMERDEYLELKRRENVRRQAAPG